MHFGLYLVKYGAISAEQFVTALERQLASRPQLGALAIELDMLSVREVFQVLRAQADNPQELFGELAVEAEMLTTDELASLLYCQSVRSQPMAEVVVELGFATPDVAQTHLSEYRSASPVEDESQQALTS